LPASTLANSPLSPASGGWSAENGLSQLLPDKVTSNIRFVQPPQTPLRMNFVGLFVRHCHRLATMHGFFILQGAARRREGPTKWYEAFSH
jgi:hypothetical protein